MHVSWRRWVLIEIVDHYFPHTFKSAASADRLFCQQGNLPILRCHPHAICLRLVPGHTEVLGALACHGHHRTYDSLILQLRAHECNNTRASRFAGVAVWIWVRLFRILPTLERCIRIWLSRSEFRSLPTPHTEQYVLLSLIYSWSVASRCPWMVHLHHHRNLRGPTLQREHQGRTIQQDRQSWFTARECCAP